MDHWHFELLRDIWPLLRESLLDPIEILPNIRGLTDNDVEGIKAAMNTNKIAAIDRLYEALRRRDINCFRSFLLALRKANSKHLVQKIMTRGRIPESFLGLDNSERCLPSVHNTITFQVPQVNSSSLQSSSTPSETRGLKDEAATSLEEEPLTRGDHLFIDNVNVIHVHTSRIYICFVGPLKKSLTYMRPHANCDYISTPHVTL